jgi:adenine-specific DNA-methyltransferase
MGGAFNVGTNIIATNKLIYNEINDKVFGVIEWLLLNDKKKTVSSIEDTIEKFKLTKRGKKEYLLLRDYYNDKNTIPLFLYVLHMYGFQNMIRFNNSQKFNTPIGVAGYSDDIKNRILNFNTKTDVNNIEFIKGCYTDIQWEDYPLDTVFYFDPPYFITSAAYNDGKRGMKGWNGDSEIELLSILTILDKLNYKFILSNVLHHRGKSNHMLIEWVEEHSFKIINAGTSGWRYAKNEVLIKNY